MHLNDWTKTLLAGVCFAAAAAAGPAWADPAFTVYGVSLASNADTVQLDGPVSAATWAGPILLSTSIGDMVTWCMDLYHDVYLGGGQNLLYQPTPITTSTTDGNGNQLTSDQVQAIGGLATYGASLYNADPTNADALAGVQLAIWSVENPGFQYSGVSDAVIADTNADIAAAPNLPAYDIGLTSLSGTQALVTTSVPEPISLTLLGSGLIGLGVVRYRRPGRLAFSSKAAAA